jgi:hypothetical protein
MSRGARRNLLLLLLAGAAGLSLWLGRSGSPEALAPSPAAIQGPALRLVVLNGTAEPNLARDMATGLGLTGCLAERIANAPHPNFERTLLVDRRLDGRVERLAARLGGLPVLKEADLEAGEDAVLILGADHRRLRPALGLPGF